MRKFRFIHAADLHLDSPFRGMASLPEAVRSVVRQSTFTALSSLVELAARERVDFVLLAGDIYDLQDRSLRAQLQMQKAAERLAAAGIPLYIVHGNHDPADGRAASLRWPDSVHFFAAGVADRKELVTPDGETLAILYGISYPTSSVNDNYAARLAALAAQDKGRYRIALLHANVDGDGGHANYAPCTKQELVESGIDYWALGHVHTRQILNERPSVVYPGNLQGRSIRETGPKGCYLVEVSELGETSLSFFPVDAVRWQQISVSIKGVENEQQLKDQLEDGMEQARAAANGRPSVGRVTFTERGPMHSILQQGTYLTELIDELRAAEAERAAAADEAGHAADFVWIESAAIQSGLELDMQRWMEDESFIGDLLRMSEELLQDKEELVRFSEKTLAPLFSRSKAAAWLDEITVDNREEWLKEAREMALDALMGSGRWEE
ncbi:DNA repair exonuclease [Paenibacillus sp. J2TS4]|uniref:metallophosphoesterase family protein n=1 Tax=Paenibacillus sp. J2TS4 TaxID=2807194 RepID=UPI001B221FCC|nr:DNA repair exonuclease [Paenibacillus sp. J2TS4]GIP33948.1 exonuclease SbcCD subunit D [Paenibacillus sp. J2TS4]